MDGAEMMEHQHKVTYCCDSAVGMAAKELETTFQEGMDQRRNEIIALIEAEQLLATYPGATFQRHMNYDGGYAVALNDIKILIKGKWGETE